MLADVKQWDLVQGTRLARLIMPRVERTVMSGADGIIANTQVLATRLAERYPETPVVWVRNGFDPERCPPRSSARGSAFIIRYTGSLYGGRSFKTALAALRQYVDRRALPPDAVRLEIAGQLDEPYRSRLRGNISRLGLDDYVTLVGPLSGAEALQRLRDSDLSLVLAQGQNLQVPAKLYESIGMGVRTLALADTDSATGREATLLGALLAEPDDVEAVSDVFDRVQQGMIGAPLPPNREILYPVIAERLHRLLEDPDAFSLEAVNFRGLRATEPVMDLSASLSRSETE
jgi:glycosyltransferase involved in cell wall biosynthesis